MTYFTNNPLERMMQQKPDNGHDAHLMVAPRGHHCHGCANYDGGHCGVCYRDLFIQQKFRKEKTNI